MGLRSDDEDGRDSYQETWDRMQEVKRLRQAVRDCIEALTAARQFGTVEQLMMRPEIRAAVPSPRPEPRALRVGDRVRLLWELRLQDPTLGVPEVIRQGTVGIVERMDQPEMPIVRFVDPFSDVLIYADASSLARDVTDEVNRR